MENDTNLVSYAEPTQAPEPVQISEGSTPNPALSEDTLNSRATKLATGVPDLGYNQDQALEELKMSGEARVRELAASAVDRANSVRNIQVVQDTVKKIGRPLTLPESMMLQDMIQRREQNPSSVLEEGYADTFMENLRRQALQNPDSDIARYFRENPQTTEADIVAAKGFKAHREMMLTSMENAQAALDQQSLFGRTADLAKYMMPFYQDWKLRGLTDTSAFFGGLGTNFDKQAGDWMHMPMDEFAVKWPGVVNKLIEANPALAMTYIGGMIHQTQQDRIMNNMFPLFDALAGYDLATAGYAGYQKLTLANQARTMVKEYAKNLEPMVTRQALHEVSGDTQMAGVVQAAEESINQFRNLQVDSPLKPLHTIFVSNLQRVIDDPSIAARSLGQETVNRLVERSAAIYEKVLNDVATSMKVDRIPAVVAYQQLYSVMADQMAKDFPHMANSIMDVKPFRDVLNSLYVDIYFGENGQKLFSTRAQAQARIDEQNIGGFHTAEIYGPPKPTKVAGTPGGFRTEQGSTYRINANGTTTRTASKFRPGDAVKVTPESAPKGKGGAKSGFTPTTEWQEVPKDAVLPPGLEIKMDMASGKNHARIPPGKEAEFATAPKAAGPRTGATGKTTGRTAQYEGKTYYEVIGKDGSPGWIAEDRLTVTKPGPSQSARGAQKVSERTVYMDVDQARAAFPPQGNYRLIDHGNGTLSTATPAKGGKSYGISPSQKALKYSETPAKGMVPIELYGGEDLGKGSTSYKGVHFGNQISEMIAGKEENVFIKNQGAGYYIVKRVPWNETNKATRDLLLTDDAAKTPASMWNAYAGGLVGQIRTTEDTLGLLQNVARKVAAFGPNKFVDLIKDSVQEIKDLKGLKSWIPGTKANQIWKDWDRVMDVSMQMPHPETGEVGVRPAFRDPGELNNIYMNTLHRPPSEQEVKAAFSFLRNHEILEAFKKMNILKQEVRQGGQTWTLGSPTAAKDKPGSTGFKFVDVEGRRITEIPGTGAIMVVRNNVMDGERVVKAESLKGKAGEAMLKSIREGKGNLIEISNPGHFPLREWMGDAWVEYAYTEQATPRAVDWGRIRTGKPARYDYEHYVVQPIIHHDPVTGKYIYLGDRTIAGHQIRAMSKDVAAKLEAIRGFLVKDDIEGARNYYQNNQLGMSFEKIQSWFKPRMTEDGKEMAPQLSLHEPISSVPFGKNVTDVDKSLYKRYDPEEKGLFRDYTAEKYGRFFEDNYQRAKGSLGDPFDVFTLENSGTKANPLYNMGQLKTIDPMVSFQRAMSRAINGMYLDDYKTMSIEHWIQEAREWLSVKEKDLASSPAYWFYNHQNHWLDETPVEIKNNLINANMAIQQFVGIQDAATTWLHQAAQKLSDSLYGAGFAKQALVANHLLPTMRDPFGFLRAMTFHAKVGLFAVPQLWVQANTFANIWGIAGPAYAAPGTKAALFYMWSRINKNPEIMAKMDEMASKAWVPGTKGFKPGWFTEATNLLEGSGFANVGREHIYRDTSTLYDFLADAGRSFLDAGTWFFNKGDQSVRVGAFYTAYLEMKNSLPTTGRLSARQAQEVLQRADLLSNNMSRASASMIHKGIFSIPAQFLSYQIRSAEQILGSRLTTVERMRLFGTYAVLYGIPGAFGLSGLPVGPYINKKAQEMGYVTGDPSNSYLNTAVTEGLPSLILGLSTGNYYNISERYANQGFDVIRDFLRSDKTFLDIVGGAAYSTMSNTIAASDGFLQSFLDGVKGEGKHPFKIEDAIDPIKQINSVGAGMRLYTALQTGKWLSNKEAYMTDVSPANAIFMSVFGLQPAGTTDVVNQAWTRDTEKQAAQKAEQIFVREMHRAFQERDNGNYEQADQYETRAWTALRVAGYPQENYHQAMAAAAKGFEPMISRSSQDFYLRNVPEDRKDNAYDAWQRFLKTQYKGN